MATQEIEYSLDQQGKTREEVRKQVVQKFLEEDSGPAEDEVYNRYRYHVEDAPEGEIWLTRPANLKLGFDFRLDVEGVTFIRDSKSPSHEDIFEDLKEKHKKDPQFAEKVRKGIIAVFDMEEPIEVLKKIKDKNIGYSVELLLKMCKWLAIEQDIRYWNGYGRVKNVIWLDLMKFYDYQYEIKKKSSGRKFYFYDEEGEEYTEYMATKKMKEETNKYDDMPIHP